MVRAYPNIVITGTPGTGKSTHTSLLCSLLPSLRPIDVSEIVKSQHFYTHYDASWDTYEVNEDDLLDYLEPLTGGTAPEPVEEGEEQQEQVDQEGEARGGLVLDWHTCDLYPERWVDLVVVLQCDHSVLWSRLEKRGYTLKKIQENNEAEIMSVVLEDARSSYPSEAIVPLRSQEPGDVEENVDRILAWIKAWRAQRGFKDDE
ncbi:factor activating pos9 [Thecaphora frezii]